MKQLTLFAEPEQRRRFASHEKFFDILDALRAAGAVVTSCEVTAHGYWITSWHYENTLQAKPATVV